MYTSIPHHTLTPFPDISAVMADWRPVRGKNARVHIRWGRVQLRMVRFLLIFHCCATDLRLFRD